MREIKFRAFLTNDYPEKELRNRYVSSAMVLSEFAVLLEHPAVILEQYIGLNDGTMWEQLTGVQRAHYTEIGVTKEVWKGLLIYEGDIVEIYKGLGRLIKCSVVWSKTTCRFYFSSGEIATIYSRHSSYRVIGNIHENPELIK